MATQYVHFTEQQRYKARHADIVEILEKQGERVKRVGDEYQWDCGNDKINIRGNVWFSFYEQEGGDAVKFVRKYFDMDYPKAVEFILGEKGEVKIKTVTVPKKEKKPFELPERNKDMRRAYAYLLITRGIDKEVLNAFIAKKMIYESAKYHNVVFVGYDEKGEAKHVIQRSSNPKVQFRGNVESTVPEYSFHWTGKSDRIYLFEAPIDMMSFISMNKQNWQQHNYASGAGVSPRVMFQMIKTNPNIKKIYLCLDNDDGGRKGIKAILRHIEDAKLNVEVEILEPKNKDWNEDLLAGEEEEEQEESEEEERCQGLQNLSS